MKKHFFAIFCILLVFGIAVAQSSFENFWPKANTLSLSEENLLSELREYSQVDVRSRFFVKPQMQDVQSLDYHLNPGLVVLTGEAVYFSVPLKLREFTLSQIVVDRGTELPPGMILEVLSNRKWLSLSEYQQFRSVASVKDENKENENSVNAVRLLTQSKPFSIGSIHFKFRSDTVQSNP
jgi:hypothetical protein